MSTATPSSSPSPAPNLAAVLKGGGLPPHPEVRPQLGAVSGRGLDRLGPRADLVGRDLRDLQVTDGGPALTVDGLGAFRNVRPDRGEVPAYVQGTVPAGVAPGTLLALAVEAGGLRRLPLKGADRPAAGSDGLQPHAGAAVAQPQRQGRPHLLLVAGRELRAPELDA